METQHGITSWGSIVWKSFILSSPSTFSIRVSTQVSRSRQPSFRRTSIQISKPSDALTLRRRTTLRPWRRCGSIWIGSVRKLKRVERVDRIGKRILDGNKLTLINRTNNTTYILTDEQAERWYWYITTGVLIERRPST